MESIKSKIDRTIDLKNIDRSRYSLNFTSDTVDLHLGYFIYDKEVAELMKGSDIEIIRYDKTSCSFMKDYDTMYFQLDNISLSKRQVIYFVFDSCGKFVNVKNGKVYRKSVLKNWSLYIDSNYPNSYLF